MTAPDFPASCPPSGGVAHPAVFEASPGVAAMTAFRTLDQVEVSGRRVLVRLDLNVPMKDGRVTDATRIERARDVCRDPVVGDEHVHGAERCDASRQHSTHLARVRDHDDALRPLEQHGVGTGLDRIMRGQAPS